MYNFMKEINLGYFKENPYHNATHIIDSLQAMHYFMSVGNLQAQLKNLDIFAIFVSNIIHDYEHPGYSNQFIVRTKHPLAIRYSDNSVLENHHLASAFSIIVKDDSCNIMKNLPWNMYKEVRQLIIQIVLNTDVSKHFSLMTTLKTKLGNNFPTDAIEDRVLILSVALRTCDLFKVVRDGRTVFQKWMDLMFDEYYKQGDMEKVLDLPISKFMDRENTNKEKAYMNYIMVVCKPMLTTFLILVQDEDINTLIFKEGVDKNKKSLDQRIDENSGK